MASLLLTARCELRLRLHSGERIVLAWQNISMSLINPTMRAACHGHPVTGATPVAGESKRVFNIDITQCEVCEKFNVKIIACITEASVINKILSYLDKQNLPEADNDSLMPPLRAPPDFATSSDYIIQHDFGFAGSVTDA